MSDGEVTSLMEAQRRRAQQLVQETARRSGIRYATWPEVQDLMRARGIDRVEVANALDGGTVTKTWNALGVTRFRVEAPAYSDPIIAITVSVHAEFLTIEVIDLELKET